MGRVVVGRTPPGLWQPWGALTVYMCVGDGNCFYRSVAVQVYGDQELYDDVRQELVEYVRCTPGVRVGDLLFSEACEHSVEQWAQETLTDGVYGGYLEAALVSQYYDVQVEIYEGVVPRVPSSVFGEGKPTCVRLRLRLGFTRAFDHYDAVFASD